MYPYLLWNPELSPYMINNVYNYLFEELIVVHCRSYVFIIPSLAEDNLKQQK